MLRYHKEVFTDPGHFKGLQTFTDRINGLNWCYSRHCLENIKSRAIDLEGLLLYIKDLKLESGQIFEYYLNDLTKEPEKVCYRVAYNPGVDIILIMGEDKNIITIYINSREDNHITLRKELYQRA